MKNLLIDNGQLAKGAEVGDKAKTQNPARFACTQHWHGMVPQVKASLTAKPAFFTMKQMVEELTKQQQAW
jgi:hypothetical protein